MEKLRNMQVRELKEELAALDEPDSKNQQARLSLLLLLLFSKRSALNNARATVLLLFV